MGHFQLKRLSFLIEDPDKIRFEHEGMGKAQQEKQRKRKPDWIYDRFLN